MITLRWAPFPGSDVVSYKVYRSVLGFIAPILSPSVLNGKTLQLKINSSSLQTITFDASTDTIAKINSVLTGARAYPSISNSAYFILRDDVRGAPGSVQVVGGTALGLLGLVPKTIYEKSEDSVISEPTAGINPEDVVEFQDPDGVCQDWYTVTSKDSQGGESAKAPARQPVTYSGPICVIEGIVTDLQGARVPEAEVTATLVKYPQDIGKCPQITLDPISVRTGSDGRFSIPLLQGTLVQIDIQSVGFSRNITVPPQAYEFLTDLQVDLDYRYPLEYRQ